MAIPSCTYSSQGTSLTEIQLNGDPFFYLQQAKVRVLTDTKLKKKFKGQGCAMEISLEGIYRCHISLRLSLAHSLYSN
jgi:hypothetical protein